MAVGFKIADGYVEVHAKVDRNAVRRAAKEAADDVDREGEKRKGSFLKWLFTPNKDLMDALSRPIAKVFSTPVLLGLAAAGVAAVANFLATAVVTALLAGLAVGFIGLGALVLQENKKIQDAYSKLGTRVHKSLERAAQPLIEPLIRGMDLIGRWFERMEPALGRIFAGVGPMIDPLINGFMGLLNNMLPGIERALPGIQAVVDALAVHMPGLGTAIGDFFATLAENEELLTRAVGLMITWLDITFKIAGPILLFFVNHFVMMADAWNFLSEQIKKGASWFIDNVVPAWIKWQHIMFAIVSFIPGLLIALGESIKNFAANAWSWLTANFSRAGEFFSMVWGKATQVTAIAFAFLFTIVTGAWGKVWGFITAIPPAIATLFVAIWNGARNATSSAWNFLTSTVPSKGRQIIDYLLGLPPRIFGIFGDMWGRAKNATSSGASSVVSFVRGVPGRILGAFGNAGNLLYGAGRSIIQGLISGIKSMVGAAVSAVVNSLKNIVSAAKNALGIGSPSKVFAMQVGHWIPEGVRVGVEKNADAPRQAIQDLVQPVASQEMGAGGAVTSTTNSPTYIQNNITLNANNLSELQQLLDFMNGKLQGSSKGMQWAGNIFESQGAFTRSHA